MAQSESKIRTRRKLSGILVLVIIGTLLISVHEFRQGNSEAGFQMLAAASYVAAALLAFILPVKCSVTTVRGRGCTKWAYGVLFGCGDVVGHRLAKFYRRLGWKQAAAKSVAPAARTSNSRAYAAGPASQYPQTIVVTVAGGGMATCGFWVGVVGTAAGVAGVILPILGLR